MLLILLLLQQIGVINIAIVVEIIIRVLIFVVAFL